MSTSEHLAVTHLTMFADPEWKLVHKARSFYPNRIFYNAAERKAAIVIERSTQGDFGLSERALRYLLDAENTGDKVVAAYVALREPETDHAWAVETARKVEENLRGVPPRDGKHGPYWWIDRTFKKPDPLTDDMPF